MVSRRGSGRRRIAVRRLSAAAVLLLFVVALAPVLARGQESRGRSAFGHVHALAFDAAGRTLWLGAHTGLFRSEDGGRTWGQGTLPAARHGPGGRRVTPPPRGPEGLYAWGHHAALPQKTSARAHVAPQPDPV